MNAILRNHIEIGEAIADPELTSLPIVDFKPIEGNIPVLSSEEVRELELTSDQAYLYEYVRAIQAWFY